MDRVILQKIGECLCVGDIIDAENIETSGLQHATEDQATDATKTVYANIDCHEQPPCERNAIE
jgi:hypothetical protein